MIPSPIHHIINVSFSFLAFRLGKSLDMFQGAVKGSRVQDPLIRLCIVGARLARTVYFIYDIFNWACRTTLLKGNSKDWAKRAAPFWFVAILFCLLRDLYEIINFHLRAKYKKENKDASIQSSLCRLPVERPDVTCDTLKNACDFLIPLNLWGKIHLSTGTVGILGLISSICGILMAANPKYKLIPM